MDILKNLMFSCGMGNRARNNRKLKEWTLVRLDIEQENEVEICTIWGNYSWKGPQFLMGSRPQSRAKISEAVLVKSPKKKQISLRHFSLLFTVLLYNVFHISFFSDSARIICWVKRSMSQISTCNAWLHEDWFDSLRLPSAFNFSVYA